jgi:endoglucanase
MNKLFNRFILAIMMVGVVTFSSCKEGEDAAPVLSVSVSELSIPIEGITSEFTVVCNEKWRISNSGSSWLQVSQVSGSSGTYTIEVSVGINNTSTTRTAILTISSDNGQSRRITCSQPSYIFPSYNTSPIAPDATGMSSTAVELAAKMHLGINFGNTMESPNEGDWQNSKLTESYVKFVKQLGFNAVRIPCNWHWSHLSDPTKAKIDPAWLDRVKEVVGWCVANDMYVLLNAHGDIGWLENNVSNKKKDSVNAMQKALWEQIATTMRDFDEHLLFAGTNEPAADDAEQMSILNSYHQTFVDAVRATGGRNSYRVLVVQGPHTNGELTYNLMNTLPVDPEPNRLMVEIHNYTPATFTLLTDADVSWGKMAYYWGAGNLSTIEPERNANSGEEEHVNEFQMMKEKFVDKGIPVLLGEYATWRRTPGLGKPVPLDTEMHNKSVDHWATYVTKQAKAHGLVPFWWEIGFMLDRANNVVKDQPMLDAIIEGGK